MDFDVILEEFLPESNVNYWEELFGVVLDVDCKTFQHEFAVKKWGVDYSNLTTKFVIRKAYCPRGKKAPWFEMFCSDTRITYNKIGSDYVMKYCKSVPAKYENIKQRYVDELAR
jgi:predicted GH43/DUF377 family glycosyl hydrolase